MEETVTACEARMFLALQAAGDWQKIQQIACASGVAPQTCQHVLTRLRLGNVVERVRVGLACHYRLRQNAAARNHAELVARAAEVLGLKKCRCGKRAA